MKTLFLLLLLNASLFAVMGKVTAISGTAQVQRSTQQIEVVKGLDILQKDQMSTAKHSRVQVILNDDTVITIGPESIYLFEYYSEQQDGEVLMQLKRGFFKTVTGKIGKVAPQKFKIKTKAATIGIRGTQFMAYVQDEEEVIGCIQGKIVVWTEQGIFDVAAGKMIVYRNRHWSIKDIEMEAFAPVMIGMNLEKQKDTLPKNKKPDVRNSYLLEEQILKDEPGNDPFSLAMQAQDNPEIPSFLVDEFIINPFPPSLDPFSMDLGSDSYIASYLFYENILEDILSPLPPFALDFASFEEQTSYLFQDQIINDQLSTTEPFGFDLGTDTTTPLPPFNP